MSCGKALLFLTLCSLHRSTPSPSEDGACPLADAGCDCGRLGCRIALYLRGEHADPAKGFGANRTETGVCHLTCRSPPPTFFSLFSFLVVVASGADTGFKAFRQAAWLPLLPRARAGHPGYQASRALGTVLGGKRLRVTEGSPCPRSHAACSWLAGAWAA